MKDVVEYVVGVTVAESPMVFWTTEWLGACKILSLFNPDTIQKVEIHTIGAQDRLARLMAAFPFGGEDEGHKEE